eukprot:6112458-Amphidinium_carterae.1
MSGHTALGRLATKLSPNLLQRGYGSSNQAVMQTIRLRCTSTCPSSLNGSSFSALIAFEIRLQQHPLPL